MVKAAPSADYGYGVFVVGADGRGQRRLA
jgi:hypothetical protein